MAAIYTFDVYCTLDGFGSYGEGGDWGGYWGKQGPEFLDRRATLLGEKQRMVFGAKTFRENVEMLGSVTEESDPVNARMKSLPATVVSSTLEGPLDWPDATVESGDAADVVARLKQESEVPLRSSGSLSLNRALMAAGLVDELRRAREPARDERHEPAPGFARLAHSQGAVAGPGGSGERSALYRGARGAGGPGAPRRGAADHPRRGRRSWWRRGDSNPQPPPCKGGALPVELRPPGGGPRSSADPACSSPQPTGRTRPWPSGASS